MVTQELSDVCTHPHIVFWRDRRMDNCYQCVACSKLVTITNQVDKDIATRIVSREFGEDAWEGKIYLLPMLPRTIGDK